MPENWPFYNPAPYTPSSTSAILSGLLGGALAGWGIKGVGDKAVNMFGGGPNSGVDPMAQKQLLNQALMQTGLSLVGNQEGASGIFPRLGAGLESYGQGVAQQQQFGLQQRADQRAERADSRAEEQLGMARESHDQGLEMGELNKTMAELSIDAAKREALGQKLLEQNLDQIAKDLEAKYGPDDPLVQAGRLAAASRDAKALGDLFVTFTARDMARNVAPDLAAAVDSGDTKGIFEITAKLGVDPVAYLYASANLANARKPRADSQGGLSLSKIHAVLSREVSRLEDERQAIENSSGSTRFRLGKPVQLTDQEKQRHAQLSNPEFLRREAERLATERVASIFNVSADNVTSAVKGGPGAAPGTEIEVGPGAAGGGGNVGWKAQVDQMKSAGVSKEQMLAASPPVGVDAEEYKRYVNSLPWGS